MQASVYLTSDQLRSELRMATRDLHATLDHHPVLTPLVKPDLSAESYGRALCALYAINQPVEMALAGFAEQQVLSFDYAPYRRMKDLAADIKQQGWVLPSPMWSGPPIGGLGDFVGCMYVLTGSSLGGLVISRQVQRSLPVTAEAGGRFFAGDGELTATRWQDFLEFSAASCSSDDIAQASRAAAQLFQSMLSLLDNLPAFNRN